MWQCLAGLRPEGFGNFAMACLFLIRLPWGSLFGVLRASQARQDRKQPAMATIFYVVYLFGVDRLTYVRGAQY